MSTAVIALLVIVMVGAILLVVFVAVRSARPPARAPAATPQRQAPEYKHNPASVQYYGTKEAKEGGPKPPSKKECTDPRPRDPRKAPLPRCPHCGKALGYGDLRCPRCGLDLGQT